MAIWACVCALSKPKETKRNNKTKGLATNPETRQVAIFFIGFGLIQINPERSGNVKLSYRRKNTIGFHASTVYTAGFFRQTNAFFKKMACCIHRGWSAVFQEAFFSQVEGPLESNVALLLSIRCAILFEKACCLSLWYTLLK